MSEFHYKSATELMSLLDAREIGARELLDHFLDRVERHNPAINAIVWQDAGRARAEADASDRRRAAGRTGAARRARTPARWTACRSP